MDNTLDESCTGNVQKSRYDEEPRKLLLCVGELQTVVQMSVLVSVMMIC